MRERKDCCYVLAQNSGWEIVSFTGSKGWAQSEIKISVGGKHEV
jgi:hypothetical protein